MVSQREGRLATVRAAYRSTRGNVVRVPDAAEAAAWWCHRLNGSIVGRLSDGPITFVTISRGLLRRRMLIIGGPGVMEHWAPEPGDDDSSPNTTIDPWGNPFPFAPGRSRRRSLTKLGFLASDR